MAYIAVDGNGQGFISERPLKRYDGDKNQPLSVSDLQRINKGEQLWIVDYSEQEKSQFPAFGKYTNRVNLSNDAILKITGKQMTFKDEPFELP